MSIVVCLVTLPKLPQNGIEKIAEALRCNTATISLDFAGMFSCRSPLFSAAFFSDVILLLYNIRLGFW